MSYEARVVHAESLDKMQLLGELSAEEFLSSYWQKKPYLVKQAIPGFESFVSGRELSELACQESIESRLVIEKEGEYPWQVIQGPLDKQDIDSLPDSHWTLLVHNVELQIAKAAKLLQSFQFIPNWRIDDLMISYSPIHSSAGPHIDQYDVFLLQAIGKKKWLIGGNNYDEDDQVPGLDLRLLNDFNFENEWILEPGDLLYLPPCFAHHGIAMEECMTYSIGFRSLSQYNLVSHYIDTTCNMDSDKRYADPDLKLQQHAGQISPDNLTKVKKLMRSILDNNDDLEQWFGQFVTEMPDEMQIDSPISEISDTEVAQLFKERGILYRNQATRTAYISKEHGYLLFVNAQSFYLPEDCEDFVTQFTEEYELNYSSYESMLKIPEVCSILCSLINLGFLNLEK